MVDILHLSYCALAITQMISIDKSSESTAKAGLAKLNKEQQVGWSTKCDFDYCFCRVLIAYLDGASRKWIEGLESNLRDFLTRTLEKFQKLE